MKYAGLFLAGVAVGFGLQYVKVLADWVRSGAGFPGGRR